MIDKAARDAELIMEIVRILDFKPWDADTVMHIAELLNVNGYKIHDVHTDDNAL